jgi:endonuclease V-like protein UPF0215 family
MHIPKKGLRALGIAESYSGRQYSTLSGIVMRKDLKIDGFAFARATVGGMDATDAVRMIVQKLARKDINVIMLSGCVISWFNVMDPGAICDETKIPVICVTYEGSEGLESDIATHFPGDDVRLSTLSCIPGRKFLSGAGEFHHRMLPASVTISHWKERYRNLSVSHGSVHEPRMHFARPRSTAKKEIPAGMPIQEHSYFFKREMK